MAEILNGNQREEALATLSGWDATDTSLSKTFVFKNFVEAFGFMTQAAIVAEKMNHHPEWSNVYKTVNVTLTTHDAGGITELDINLAKHMDELAS
jgi:4a-hydroxytetrahydrobiopterin dehydratase